MRRKNSEANKYIFECEMPFAKATYSECVHIFTRQNMQTRKKKYNKQKCKNDSVEDYEFITNKKPSL